jgi:hypothetical protein
MQDYFDDVNLTGFFSKHCIYSFNIPFREQSSSIVEPTRLQKVRKAKELAETHIDRSWEKELEGVETYCQRQEKMEETSRQPMFLTERRTVLFIIIFVNNEFVQG